MNEFKIGDWVRTNHFTKQIVKVQKEMLDGNKHIYGYKLSNGEVLASHKLELWKPKEGEWCWSKYDGLVKVLKITQYDDYTEYEVQNPFRRATEDYIISGLEPFIGTLPTFIKDKQ